MSNITKGLVLGYTICVLFGGSPVHADTTELACEGVHWSWEPASGSFAKYVIYVQWPASPLAPFKGVAMSPYACFTMSRGRMRAKFQAADSMRIKVAPIRKGGEIGPLNEASEWVWWKDLVRLEMNDE